MDPRRLGRCGLRVSPIGFGAFKIGRNQGAKYAAAYALPDEAEVERLLGGVLDLGINYFDTAPAYGLSEERLGRFLSGRRREGLVISTKVGETFEEGRSTYDFSGSAIRASVERSLKRLRTDVLDVVFIHANADDLALVTRGEAVETLMALRTAGHVRAIGLSGKTVEAARASLAWADVLMVEYHVNDTAHDAAMREAAAAGVGIVVKKGLASGRLDAARAIPFVLGHPAVAALVVGGLNLEHIRANVRAAERPGGVTGRPPAAESPP